LNNSSVALNGNCDDSNISDHNSDYTPEITTSKSSAQAPGDNENRKDRSSLIDKYNKLVITVKKLEDSVKELQKRNEELNDFVSIGTHELKAPLMPILGIMELLELELSETGKNEIRVRKDEVESIIRNARRLSKIASEILDVAKIESRLLVLRKKAFDLSELILKTINDYKKIALQKDVKILYQQYNGINSTNLEVDVNVNNATRTFVFADVGRIAQVISNLLDNAVKYTGSGGNITVSMTKKISKSGNRKDEKQFESIMDVTDSGSGIDPELLEDDRLFSKFSSNYPSGTGLGLYISKKIVEAHDGRIWAQNNPNKKGASFKFTLPLRLSC
jgi:signal transduction histidine kinase